MGFFSTIANLFRGSKDPADLADEVERYADRFENAGDDENAALARDYARRIRKTIDEREAKRLFDEFKAAVRGVDDDSRRHRDHEDSRDEDSDDDTWSDDS